jgi:RHS repeat-associated protein
MCLDGFKDGPALTTTDYQYDDNGNMISDANKGITSITYNHLDLPVKITFGISGNNTIEYLYDAAGNKLGKKVTTSSLTTGSLTTTTDYLSGFQYQDGVLQFFPTAEGYVQCTPFGGSSIYNYVFQYTDHLGNVRLTYGKDSSGLVIMEENNYYPYGLKHVNYNAQTYTYSNVRGGGFEVDLAPVEESIYKYKFNGQERQEELGLNLYDMPFRDYDPAIGRWTGIDPMVDFDRTPYGAHNGNPVFWADPSGANAEFDQWISNTESDWAAIDAGANPFEVFFNRMMSDQQHNNAIKRAFNVLVSLFPGDTGGGGVGMPDDAIEVSEVEGDGGPGDPLNFFGATIRIIPNINAAGYFGGAINIDQETWDNYVEKGLHSPAGFMLMHEYGHFIQNWYYGDDFYNKVIVPSSLVNNIFSTRAESAKFWTEVQASTMAFIYFGFPRHFTEDDNVINFKTVPASLSNLLYNQYQNYNPKL